MLFAQNIQRFIINNLTPNAVWLFFVIIAGLVAFTSVVIIWHWAKYGKGFFRSTFIELIYVIVTIGLLVTLFTSIQSLIKTL